MKEIKDVETNIRERWFANHQATYSEHGDLKVLEWAEPGTNTYSCRYVFDGNKMYISGDIGEAVFWLTWKADVHSFNDISIGYFEEKLAAYSQDRRDYKSEKAVQMLEEWKEKLNEDDIEYDPEEFDALVSAAESCSRKDEWAFECVNGTYYDFIRDLDQDMWEWIYNIGDEIPARIKGYLIGLKMASEQLKSKVITA